MSPFIVDSLNTHAVISARGAAPRGLSSAPMNDLPSRSDWQALLSGTTLSPAELLALNAIARLRELPAGATVFARAQPASELLAVLSGSVGLGLARVGQAAHLERSIRGPAWLDLGSAWLGEGHAQDAWSLSPVRILALPLPALRELMAVQPAMSERLLAGLARTVRSLVLMAHDLMHKDAEKRLAAWLLQGASSGCGEGPALLQLGQRKRDIAAQLAITPETLSRMMRQLKLKGLIEVQGYTVRLLDAGALRALAAD